MPRTGIAPAPADRSDAARAARSRGALGAAASLFGVLILAKALSLTTHGLPWSAWTPFAYFWQDAAVALAFGAVHWITGRPAISRLLFIAIVAYAAINEGNTHTASLSFVETAEELRAEGRTHQIIGVDEAIERVRGGAPLGLHPLTGGLPPEIAWRYLETVADKVMPALS